MNTFTLRSTTVNDSICIGKKTSWIMTYRMSSFCMNMSNSVIVTSMRVKVSNFIFNDIIIFNEDIHIKTTVSRINGIDVVVGKRLIQPMYSHHIHHCGLSRNRNVTCPFHSISGLVG